MAKPQRQAILDFFAEHVRARPNAPAALIKRSRQGRFEPVSWAEVDARVKAIGAGLLALGVAPGDRVCLICTTRLEWVLADLAIVAAGAVTVPIYPSERADACQMIAQDSDAVVVCAENAEQVRKFRSERHRLPHVRAVVQLTGAVEGDDGWVLGFEALCERGRHNEHALDERRAHLHPEAIATIIYTSGTTGQPKGVVTTHSALIYEAEAISDIRVVKQGHTQLLFLPLAHSFAKMLMVGWLATGHVLAFAESSETLQDNMREVRPEFMAAVPRFYEKLVTQVMQQARQGSWWSSELFKQALVLSRKHGQAELAGKQLPLHEMLAYQAAKYGIFRNIGQALKQAMGGRLAYLASGGAPLPLPIAWFLRDAGLSVLEGYGLTETAAVTCLNRPWRNHVGTVGWPLPDTKVRIAPDGEVWVKGPGVMREYWRRPEETAAALKEGWFATGDLGTFDAAHALRITGRKKDIIVTASGKNVAPLKIEALLRADPLISYAVVHGDGRAYLTALVTLDAEALRTFAAKRGFNNRSYAELTQLPSVRDAVERVVAKVNASLPPYEAICKFCILEHDFAQATGELTPTHKIKRSVINNRYASILDCFYDAPATTLPQAA